MFMILVLCSAIYLLTIYRSLYFCSSWLVTGYTTLPSIIMMKVSSCIRVEVDILLALLCLQVNCYLLSSHNSLGLLHSYNVGP